MCRQLKIRLKIENRRKVAILEKEMHGTIRKHTTLTSPSEVSTAGAGPLSGVRSSF